MEKRILFFVVAVLVAFAAFAESFTKDDFTYSIYSDADGEVSLTKAKADADGTLVIPSVVENDGKYYTVVHIGFTALSESGATLTVIPPTVRSISSWGLYGISGVLVIEDDDDQGLERASTLSIASNQFSGVIDGFYLEDGALLNRECSQFSKIYIGRNIKVDGVQEEDPNDPDPRGILVYDVIVGQRNLEEVVVGPKVDDIDRLIGCNRSHRDYKFHSLSPADNYELVPDSYIRKFVITNKDAVLKMPLYTFGGTVKADGSVVQNTTTKLYVPAGMIDVYTGETSDWRFFKNVEEYDVYDLKQYDLDGDGVINAADVSSMFAFMMVHLDDMESGAFDINRDGTTNVGDLSALYSAVINGSDQWWLLIDPDVEGTFYDEQGILYRAISDDEASVLKFPKEATEVVIPERVEHDGREYRVTRISSYASNDVVTRLVIPASIDSIEHHGLYKSLNLKDLSILGSDDAKPLRVGLAQFMEYLVEEADTTYFSNNDWFNTYKIFSTGPNDTFGHAQLDKLYVDRDIIKPGIISKKGKNGSYNFEEVPEQVPLLSHQIHLGLITVGEHVTDLTGIWGGSGTRICVIDTLYVYAKEPPFATVIENFNDLRSYQTVGKGGYGYGGREELTFIFDAFESIKLFIPKESYSKYQADTNIWGRFKNINFIEE